MTFKAAIILSHGSPSTPLPQDRAMDDLAAAVMALLPGWVIRGGTLASPPSLARAFAGLESPLIYPFFMADGHLTKTLLPKRVAPVATALRQMPAFGSDPAVQTLAAEATREGARRAGLKPEETALLLAAHGSKIVAASRLATLALAQNLSATTSFRAITWGFIEEAPLLADAARGLGQAICLPLFTLRAGHVAHDLPTALQEAGFEGVVLPHLGAHPEVPRIIAAALARA
jgi:sirohydrochlorin ferrochelatase